MDKRIAVFPGSFDPPTLGHCSLVERSAGLFDELVVAIGVNSTKKSMFSLEKRISWLEEVFKDLSNVSVRSYSGLTVDFCRSLNAKFMIRGLRNSVDFQYEQSIAQMSGKLNEDVETIALFAKPELGAINARIVREIIQNKGDVSAFLPKCVNVYED